MLAINIVPIFIESFILSKLSVRKYSRMFCHRIINNKNEYCPSFCFFIKKSLIGRTRTYNEHLFLELAHKLNLKILEKRAAFEVNHVKNLYYHHFIIELQRQKD